MSYATPKRLRFNSDDDLCLLREVVEHHPLQYPQKWNVVQENIRNIVGKEFSIRTLKDHLMILMKKSKTKSIGDRVNVTQEFYSEKDFLLQELSSMCKELEPPPAKKSRVLSKETQIALLAQQDKEYSAVKEDKDPTTSIPEINFVEIEDQTQNRKKSVELNEVLEFTQNRPKQRKWIDNTARVKLRNLKDIKYKKSTKEKTEKANALQYHSYCKNNLETVTIPEDEKPAISHPPSKKKVNLSEESNQGSFPDTDIDKVVHCSLSKKIKEEPLDGVDHLFLSYAATFKTFQPLTQAKMKLKLATIFSETELHELEEQKK